MKKGRETAMIAAYMRVSTTDQHTGSQRAEIEKYLASNAVDSSRVIWYEDKETGTTMRRPAFERMQKDIFNGKVKSVVIWKLDRLSRKMRDGINVLADWADRGLRVAVVTQQIEFNGTIGRIVAALLLGLSEIEYSNIKERQKAGIEAAKARGVFTGRKAGTFKAKPERARTLFKKGNTTAEIANALNISERTVRRYLGGS
jgi:DNA invertase Pin-like site-specific DNA recombinase